MISVISPDFNVEKIISLYPFTTMPAPLVVENGRFKIKFLVFLPPSNVSKQYKILCVKLVLYEIFHTNSCTWKYVLQLKL